MALWQCHSIQRLLKIILETKLGVGTRFRHQRAAKRIQRTGIWLKPCCVLSVHPQLAQISCDCQLTPAQIPGQGLAESMWLWQLVKNKPHFFLVLSLWLLRSSHYHPFFLFVILRSKNKNCNIGTSPRSSLIKDCNIWHQKYRSPRITVTPEALTLILKYLSFLHTWASSFAFLINLSPSFF